MEALDHGLQVEALEFLGVVERLTHRVGEGGVLVENLNVQLVRPPVTVRLVHDRALARVLVGLCVHVSLQACAAFSRSIYKNHRFLESDPASWPAAKSCSRVTGTIAQPATGIDGNQGLQIGGGSLEPRRCVGG